MAYNRNLPAGTYRVRALQADTNPTKNGEGLMLYVEWAIVEGEYEGCQITSRQCLIDNSGNVTKNYESVREWAKSWDGVSTDYFKGHFSEWDADIVVERVQSTKPDENGELPMVPDVKWVNDHASSHGAKIEAGDHKTLSAKFGAKLRAAAGNWRRTHPDRKPQAAAPAGASAPTPSAPTPSAPTPNAGTPPAAQQPKTAVEMKKETWALFCERNPSLPPGDDRNQMFFKTVARVTPETNYDAISAATWQKVIDLINNEMPF